MDSRRDLEQQVLIEEIRKYQIDERNNAEVIGITYILATLIVVIILVMFMQQKAFQRKLREVWRKCKKTTKDAKKAITGDAAAKDKFWGGQPSTGNIYKSPVVVMPSICVTSVKKYNDWFYGGKKGSQPTLSNDCVKYAAKFTGNMEGFASVPKVCKNQMAAYDAWMENGKKGSPPFMSCECSGYSNYSGNPGNCKQKFTTCGSMYATPECKQQTRDYEDWIGRDQTWMQKFGKHYPQPQPAIHCKCSDQTCYPTKNCYFNNAFEKAMYDAAKGIKKIGFNDQQEDFGCATSFPYNVDPKSINKNDPRCAGEIANGQKYINTGYQTERTISCECINKYLCNPPSECKATGKIGATMAHRFTGDQQEDFITTTKDVGSSVSCNPMNFNVPSECQSSVKTYNSSSSKPMLPCNCTQYVCNYQGSCTNPSTSSGPSLMQQIMMSVSQAAQQTAALAKKATPVVTARKFTDLMEEFDEVLEQFADHVDIETYEDMMDQCHDVQGMFDDLMEEHFEDDSFVNTSRFVSPIVMSFAADAEQAKITANITNDPEVAQKAAQVAVLAAKNAAAASIAESASAETAQVAQAALSNAKDAIADAQKTAAGVPKMPVSPPWNPIVGTKILGESDIPDAHTFDAGFPETEPNPGIQDYDSLDADQYSSTLVNEIADPRTVANHNEWVKEVGNQSTLPMHILRDGFELADYYHGVGIRNFSPDRPKNFNVVPITQEL